MTVNAHSTATDDERAATIAAFRADHRIVPFDEVHEDFGLIHRCASCGVRVHWIVRGYRHDLDEVKAMLDAEYGGAWGGPS